MTAKERTKVAVVVQKYCRALKTMNSSAQKAADEAMEKGINARTTPARQYFTALEYVKRIDPAWNTLTDTDQHVLEQFYGMRMQRSGAAKRTAEELGVSERQAYYLCSKARQRFADALAALSTTKEKGADDDEDTNG